MSDYINRADKVIEHALSRHGGHGTYLDAARALDDAGLLATAEHDAAVAARAMREAAEMWSIEDYIETALGGLNYVRGRLIEHADLLNSPTEEYEPCCRYCGEPGSDCLGPCC